MKKLIIAAVLLLSGLGQSFATEIVITIRTKSAWNASSKSCADSQRGCCIRISNALAIDPNSEFQGKMDFNKTSGIVLQFNKSEISRTLFSTYFSSSAMKIDGDSPISTDVLSKIGYPFASEGFTVRAGLYKYTISGDIITVIIPTN